MIRDQVIYEKKMNFLQTKCFACASKNHISIDCPLIHYVPDNVKVVKKYMIDPGQKSRKNFKRTRNTKFNSLFSLALVKQTSQNIKELFSEISSDEIYQDFSIEMEGINSNSNFEQKPEIIVNEETGMKIEKSSSQKFSQYFLKEKSIEKIPKSFNEFDNQLESSVIIEKIGPENFSSAWDSHQIIEIPENENGEITKEKPLIEETKLAFANTELDDAKKLEASNYRLRSKITVDNYLDIPSRAIQKSFNSDQSSNSNLNGNTNPKPCLKPRLSFIPQNDFRSSEVQSACLISKNSLNSKGNSNSGISARIPVRQDARKNSITAVVNNNNITKNLPTLKKMSSKGNIENCEQNDNNNEQNTDLTDIFIKEFEKGTNFKNFYPDSNLKTVLLENKRKSKKMKSPGLKMARSPVCLNKKMKAIVKINKIVPEAMEIDKTSPLRKETIISRKNSRRYSNIFVKRSETKFSEKKIKMSFYDIVSEVLHNQELRKKLALMRKKSLNRKKTNT